MKKIAMLVAAFAAMCSSSAFAQNVNLPTAGTLSTEVQFTPFSDGDQFKLDGLKLRYFLTDQDAVRLTIGLQMNNKNTTPDIQDPGSNASTYDKNLYDYQVDNNENKTKTGKFSLDLGYERHFLQAGRLDLYAGAELGIEMAWAKTTAVTGQGDGVDKFWTYETETTGGDNAWFGFGAKVFTGLDFYLYKGLYVGTELGLGFTNKSFKDKETSWTNNNPNANPHSGDATATNNRSESSLKFYVEPNVRLGWTF